MNENNRKTYEKPIIKRCVLLYEMILNNSKNAPKDIRYSIIESTLKSAHILYIQAFRQVRGKDYLKRAIETVNEIQADIYLVMLMHGWSKKVCSMMDVLCDEILSILYANEIIESKGQSYHVQG